MTGKRNSLRQVDGEKRIESGSRTRAETDSSTTVGRRTYMKLMGVGTLIGGAQTVSAEETGYGAGGYGEGGYGGDGSGGGGSDPTPEPPVVESDRATDLSESEATLTGTLEGLGTAEEALVGFEWRRADGDEWATTDMETLESSDKFEEAISDLEESTEYEFRAVAETDDGSDAGATLTFVTEEPEDEPPTVRTRGSSDVDDTSAIVTGEVTDIGGADEVNAAFEWREDGSSEWRTTSPQILDTPAEFREELSELTAETSYEFRAIADSEEGAERGDTRSFTTEEPEDEPPAVSTDRATEITDTSSTLTGEVTDLGGADEVEAAFEWREDGASEWRTTSSKTLDTSGAFADELHDLEPGTEYEFRAIAETDWGSDAGDVVSFVTDEARDEAEPTIERFDLTEWSNPAWSRVKVEWAVSHEGEQLEHVETRLLRTGSVLDSEESSVSGSTADGEHSLRTRERSDRYTVQLTVTDTEGNTVSSEKTIDL